MLKHKAANKKIMVRFYIFEYNPNKSRRKDLFLLYKMKKKKDDDDEAAEAERVKNIIIENP